MKKILKRASILVAFALMITLFGMPAGSHAKVYRGTWYKNTKWTYDTRTKTVTIACKGKMEDNFSDHGPATGWRKWYLKAKKVVFQKGITYIGGGTFHNFRKVEEVVLPEGLVSIGSDSFWFTSNLKQIRFPSTLKRIGARAFDGSGLESVTLQNVEKIRRGAFTATNLKSLTIPSGCTDIQRHAFSSCSKLKKVILGNGIQTISAGMFLRSGIESVTIPPSVTKIGSRAFFAFSPEEGKLKNVTVNSTKITEWGKDVFGKARKDLVIKVPKSKKKEYTKALRKGGLPDYVKIVGF